MFEHIELIYEGQVAQIWLNRPAALNALSSALMQELDTALDQVAASEARVFILAGRGPRAFCAGADIKEFKPVATTVQARAKHYSRDVFSKIERMAIPTIAALHGFTLGGGLELALCCDLRFAAQDTQFGFPETGLGTFPGAGATQRVPRLIGRSQAMWLIFTGQRIDADHALRLGMVNAVFPTGELLERTLAQAAMIAANAPLGIAYAKEAMVRGEKVSLEEGIRIETDLNMFMDTTEDYIEGAKAFIERRRPVFHGR